MDKKIGQPGVRDGQGYKYRFGAILERPNDDDISGRQTPKDLVIGCGSLKRLSGHDGELSPDQTNGVSPLEKAEGLMG